MIRRPTFNTARLEIDCLQEWACIKITLLFFSLTSMCIIFRFLFLHTVHILEATVFFHLSADGSPMGEVIEPVLSL